MTYVFMTRTGDPIHPAMKQVMDQCKWDGHKTLMCRFGNHMMEHAEYSSTVHVAMKADWDSDLITNEKYSTAYRRVFRNIRMMSLSPTGEMEEIP